MKTIISIYGSAQTGKTSTLNVLIGLLDKTLMTSDVAIDRRVAFDYNGSKLAVTTYGDDAWQIRENIKFFEENKCDIFITASRTRGATIKELINYKNTINSRIIWVRNNTAEKLIDLINESQAKDIKAIIDSL